MSAIARWRTAAVRQAAVRQAGLGRRRIRRSLRAWTCAAAAARRVRCAPRSPAGWLRAWACAAAAAATTGCADSPEVVTGEWISIGATGPSMIYVFGDGGTMEWILDLDAGPDTFSVPYRIDYEAVPVRLDVGPWRRGPLEGRTLLGIVDVQGPDRIRVDFEPSRPGGDGTRRPTEFTEQAVVFVRRRE